ncbi:hypothetical protein D6C98_00501 [Aureobasidium pullulans]|uniref:BTB domain-containing protein n=1 Tax=Aureobasidium pullulans TaxID=5580 RepID=A0A4S9P676_AURPU|nr:hypothetical protein D6C98_00501 [Aureobasidium pullulans]THY75094.1 hypothetical protein D6C94_04379 [Aureobasidium pullulans]THZ43593.1 hypothetical protein D6C87_04211 [Aureobasidium pullulans]TIA55979.1 hypothetical protein D6C79_00160 [Aureobasidium pullulans]
MSFRDSISGPVARIVVGSQAEEFLIPKKILCASSTYFKAALTGQFMEGNTQKIVLDDTDAEVFRTFVAWLYQGHLKSSEISKVFTKMDDFEDHVTSMLLFADMRGVPDLLNDATTLLLDYLEKTGLARSLTIQRVYMLPDDFWRSMLVWLLFTEEIHFGSRIKSDDIHQLPKAFIVKVLQDTFGVEQQDVRMYASRFSQSFFCSSFHKHGKGEKCSPRALNYYDGPVTVLLPSAIVENPSKKRKTAQR